LTCESLLLICEGNNLNIFHIFYALDNYYWIKQNAPLVVS